LSAEVLEEYSFVNMPLKNMEFLLALQLPGGTGFSFIITMGLMVGVFYFLVIMPQQRRQKKWQAMLESIKTGDRVTTTGGLRGTVVALKEDAIHLRVPPDNLRLEVTKASVAQLTTADEEAKTK
jgi:preprotein translocase subunit YajC